MSSVAAAQNPESGYGVRPQEGAVASSATRPYGARRTFGRAACAAVADLIRLGDALAPLLTGAAATLLCAPIAPAPPAVVLVPALTALGAVLALPKPGPHPLRLGSLAGQVLARGLLAMLASLLIGGLVPTSPPLRWWILYGSGLLSLLIVVRLAALALCQWCERTGRFRDVVAVVGAGEPARALVRSLSAASPAESEIIGLFRPASPERDGPAETTAGSLEDLVKSAPEWGVTHVIMVASEAESEGLKAWTDLCLRLAVELRHYAGSGLETTGPGLSLSGSEFKRLSAPPLGFWQRAAKRALDFWLGLVLLIFFSPLMLVAAAAIRLESPGPALFRQRRRGFNNVEIWVYKFRTMWAHAEDPSGSRQTELNDPRVTRVGRLLRASSLDELPQLLNVLRGDMSLVGPRPHPIGMRVGGVLCEDAILAYPHRHRVKPGITGLAQIEGSRGPAVELSALSQRLAYDFDYIAAASIWLDLKILALTPLRLMTSKAF